VLLPGIHAVIAAILNVPLSARGRLSRTDLAEKASFCGFNLR